MGDRESGHPPPPVKSEVAICFLRNSGTLYGHHSRRNWTTLVQMLLEAGRTVVCEIQLNMHLAATPKEDQKLVFKADYRVMQVKSIY